MSETMPDDVPIVPPDGATVEVLGVTWMRDRGWWRASLPHYTYAAAPWCDILTALWRERELRKRDAEDAARLDWLEQVHTLHGGVEFLYVVDGYTLTLTHDGNALAEFFGSDLRAAIDAARAKGTNEAKDGA